MKPVIHQVLIGAAEGDAITQMAMSVRDTLRQNATSDVYGFWRHGDVMNSECLDLNKYPPSSEVDLTLYHLSIGLDQMTEFLRTREEMLALSYHNITPSHFYAELNSEFATSLDLGRKDLGEFQQKISLVIADSKFNARDLDQYGYQNVHVIPAGFTPSRLANEEYDFPVMNEMARRFPNGYVVAVGQILPHKRIDQLIEAMHLMNSTYWGNIGLVICGTARQELYRVAVSKFQSRCAMVDVCFTGQVTDQQLSSYIRGARAYLGMSDHEGLSIPPIEAMSMGVPVIVKGAAAVPETVGDGALVLPSNAGPVLAGEAVHEVLTNDQLRWRLIQRGFAHVAELEARDSASSISSLLLDSIA